MCVTCACTEGAGEGITAGVPAVICMHQRTCCGCSLDLEAVEQLLLKIGSVLEFAEPFVEQLPCSSRPGEGAPSTVSSMAGADERLSSRAYTNVMVHCARLLLAECCRRSWPALAAKARSCCPCCQPFCCMAARSCASFLVSSFLAWQHFLSLRKQCSTGVSASRQIHGWGWWQRAAIEACNLVIDCRIIALACVS